MFLPLSISGLGVFVSGLGGVWLWSRGFLPMVKGCLHLVQGIYASGLGGVCL